MGTLRNLDPTDTEEFMLMQTSSEMRRKLNQKIKEGINGWSTPRCSNEKLKQMLIRNLEEGDMIDVMNLAGMMHMRKIEYGEAA